MSFCSLMTGHSKVQFELMRLTRGSHDPAVPGSPQAVPAQPPSPPPPRSLAPVSRLTAPGIVLCFVFPPVSGMFQLMFMFGLYTRFPLPALGSSSGGTCLHSYRPNRSSPPLLTPTPTPGLQSQCGFQSATVLHVRQSLLVFCGALPLGLPHYSRAFGPVHCPFPSAQNGRPARGIRICLPQSWDPCSHAGQVDPVPTGLHRNTGTHLLPTGGWQPGATTVFVWSEVWQGRLPPGDAPGREVETELRVGWRERKRGP